ncbi:hypothetical protein OE09_2478 [Flavobacteriaceae bacterium MAR_2010_72]|nr:hypothetical protein OE09_2478 [Flavobacteriaceae bacterium MAR_2010_72]TVZ58819.1 hypothetical protein NA63_1327 [Flavobacteriaceae bacterium MAR_2010_105]
MIYSSKYFVPNGYSALTIFPFVFLKHKFLKGDKILINHEHIHLKQQLELLILPFFVWYGLEFLFRLAAYKKWNLAYKNISFEREAYQNDSNLKYLNSRSFWSFVKYI